MSNPGYRMYVTLDAEVAQKQRQSAIGNDEYQIVIVDGSVFRVQHHYERKDPNPRSHMWTSDTVQQPDLPQPVVDAFQTQLSACSVAIGGDGNRPDTPNVVNKRIMIRIQHNKSTYEFEKRPSAHVEIRKDGNATAPNDVPSKVRNEAESILGGNFDYLHHVIHRP
jgi:hypothetical protein